MYCKYIQMSEYEYLQRIAWFCEKFNWVVSDFLPERFNSIFYQSVLLMNGEIQEEFSTGTLHISFKA